jgi:hypothetical protein
MSKKKSMRPDFINEWKTDDLHLFFSRVTNPDHERFGEESCELEKKVRYERRECWWVDELKKSGNIDLKQIFKDNDSEEVNELGKDYVKLKRIERFSVFNKDKELKYVYWRIIASCPFEQEINPHEKVIDVLDELYSKYGEEPEVFTKQKFY